MHKAKSSEASFIEEPDASSKIHTKVVDALSSLEWVKQVILEKRFGLEGNSQMSYEQIALFLSTHLPPEIKFEIVKKINAQSDEAVIGEDDVISLEAEALRELSRPGKKETRIIT